MNKKLTLVIIGFLVFVALFRPAVQEYLLGVQKEQEAAVEIKTSISEDPVGDSTVEFTPSEIEWLTSNNFKHLTTLVKDEERLRVKAFISIQKNDELNMSKYIDSLKRAHPELKDVDLTKVPDLAIPENRK